MRPHSVIFLPGFMCDERLFKPQIKAMVDPINCHVADISGQESISGIATYILNNVPSKFAVAGLSMGGIIALEIYRQASERVTHMALLNTTPFADRSQAQRQKHIERVKQGDMPSVISEELKPKYLALAKSNAEILNLVMKMADSQGAETFVRQSFALLFRKAYLDVLPTITCPTLVLTGMQDGVCGPDISAIMAEQIPNAQYRILENCGHLSTLEQPDKVSAELASLFGMKTNIGVKAD